MPSTWRSDTGTAQCAGAAGRGAYGLQGDGDRGDMIIRWHIDGSRQDARLAERRGAYGCGPSARWTWTTT